MHVHLEDHVPRSDAVCITPIELTIRFVSKEHSLTVLLTKRHTDGVSTEIAKITVLLETSA